MERKKIEKIDVLKCSFQSSLKTLMTDTGNWPTEIVEKANELGLEITGPMIWRYEGSDGKPDTMFKLEICLPVKEPKGNPGKFSFETLPSVECVSEMHKGPWMKMGDTYNKMMGEMSRKSIVSTCTSREVYLTCDFENQENCLTEVQIELP